MTGWLLLALCVAGACAAPIHLTFDDGQWHGPAGAELLGQTQVRSLLRCQKVCMEHNACKYYSYEPVAQLCVLTRTTSVLYDTAQSQWRYNLYTGALRGAGVALPSALCYGTLCPNLS